MNVDRIAARVVGPLLVVAGAAWILWTGGAL